MVVCITIKLNFPTNHNIKVRRCTYCLFSHWPRACSRIKTMNNDITCHNSCRPPHWFKFSAKGSCIWHLRLCSSLRPVNFVALVCLCSCLRCMSAVQLGYKICLYRRVIIRRGSIVLCFMRVVRINSCVI